MAVRQLRVRRIKPADRLGRQARARAPIPSRRPNLRIDLDGYTARSGQPLALILRVTSLASNDPPLYRGRSLVDCDLSADVVDAQGATQAVAVQQREPGTFALDFTPERSGLHTLNLDADGQGFSFVFQALPEEA